MRGGWIQKIYQPSARTLSLTFACREKRFDCWCPARPGSRSVTFIRHAPINPSEATELLSVLRAHFQGARMMKFCKYRTIASSSFSSRPRMVFVPWSVTSQVSGRLSRSLMQRDGCSAETLRSPPGPTRLCNLNYLLWTTTRGHATVPNPDFIKAHDGEFPSSAAIEAYYQSKPKPLRRRTESKRLEAARTEKGVEEDSAPDTRLAGRSRSSRQVSELCPLRGIAQSQCPLESKKGWMITLIDYFDEAMPEITIPLDLTKSARSNAMDDYLKSTEKPHSERRLAPRLEQAARELSAIQNELTDIDQGRWAFRSRLQTASIRMPSTRRRRWQFGPFRRFCSADGLPIFVGRNARENDDLTFGLAKSEDLWLHARGTPGSHVIVRLEKGQEAPLESLRDAATLALLYSDLKKSGKGEVIYTKRKWVKKAKNQAPGAVMVTQEQSLYVHLDRIRLQALKQRATGD